MIHDDHGLGSWIKK